MYKLLPILLFAYCFAITTDDIYDNSYALIIGIDKYKNVQNLNYAVKDAESIQDILVNTFDFPEGNVTLLKNEDATKQNIIQAFSDITTKAEESDRVLIYFAGHGDTDDLPDGGEMGYLLPVDGNDENLYVSSIAMDELKRISLMSKAKHLLYLVDACYGGLLTIGSRGIDPQTTSNYIDKITEDKARQIITAGGRDEEVMEKSEWGHSAFTKNLIRALKDGKADYSEDGIITAAELGIYLNEKVTIDSENQQTPQYGRMTSQEGEFVFVYSENTAVNQDKSADAKLDLLPSGKEELKSHESSDDGTMLERMQWSKWRKTYAKNLENPEVFGIGFNNFVENNTLNHGLMLFGSVSKETAVSFSFHSSKKDLLNENMTPTESLTISSDYISIGIHTAIHDLNTENMWLDAGGGMYYVKISWQAENNTSDYSNKITPWLFSGIGFRPVPDLLPMILMDMLVIVTFVPQTYNEIDGINKIDDWQIQFMPNINISIIIPKFILFPE